MKRKLFFTFLLFFIIVSVYAQENNRYYPEFIINEKTLQNPFTGGFEAPQVQEIDLNLDGLDDLLVVDRKGAAIRTFINNPSLEFPFEYRPEFEPNLPALPCWVKVRDFNGDGFDDLFTCETTSGFFAPGVEVWMGFDNDGKLGFTPFDHQNEPYNIIYYKDGSNDKQLYVEQNGAPGIRDIDGDGDIDILVFQPSGFYLYFLKNMSVESGYGQDSLHFELADDCWGKFFENESFVLLSEDPDECAIPDGLSNAQVRHSGVSLTTFDGNNDNLIDLLYGEIISDSIFYIENGGTPDDAFAVFLDTNFPSTDKSVKLKWFVSSHIVDADQDGVKDILFTPNEKFGTNTQQIYLYKNSIENSGFQFEQRDWLVEHSLDFGSDSYPSFFDYNSDGLMDLVIGTFGLTGLEEEIQTRIFLFENIGTSTQPIFELITDDYLGFSAYSTFDRSYNPCFGDLDGDGDQDLLIGTSNGELIFLENIALEGEASQFAEPVFDYFELDTENNTISVSISDINSDGLQDIIVGGFNSYSLDEGIGALKVFKNFGTNGNPLFSNEEVIYGLGDINVKEAFSFRTSASPRYISGSDAEYLIVGNELGRLSLYEIDDSDEFVLISEDFMNGERFGNKVTVDLFDIDSDGYLEMVMGNERGGLNFFNTIIQSSGLISSTNEVQDHSQIKIYPNPSRNKLTLIGNLEGITNYRVSNLSGQIVKSGRLFGQSIETSRMMPGIYTLVLEKKNSFEILKFVKI